MGVFTRGFVKFKNIEIVQGGLKIGIGGVDLPVTNYFVDGTLGKSGNRGLGWGANNALDTIAGAMTKVTALATRGRARIYVAPAAYSEAVSTPTNTAGAHCALIGVNPLDVCHGAVYWASGATGSDCLTVLARGWRVSGFEFECPTSAAGVKLDSTNGNANYTQIDGCHFTGGKYGIDAIGAPNYAQIKSNLFSLLQTAGAVAIGATAGANCNVWLVEDNLFVANINHIVFVAASAPYSGTWRYNTLHDTWVPGGSVTSAMDLTTSAASNVIYHNFFGGTFSISGGYRGGSTDEWFANFGSTGIDYETDPA